MTIREKPNVYSDKTGEVKSGDIIKAIGEKIQESWIETEQGWISKSMGDINYLTKKDN